MGFSSTFHPCFHIMPNPFYSPLKRFSTKISWTPPVLMVKRSDVLRMKAVENEMRNVNGSDAMQHTGILLQRLLNETQKLNQFAFPFPGDVVESEPESLYVDLLAVVDALKSKEGDLLAAETDLVLDYEELNRAKEQLELREKAVAEACTKHELLEEELKRTTIKLASQAMDIESLKIQLQEKEKLLMASKATILFQQDELVKMRTELDRKTEEVFLLDSELKRKSNLLESASEVVSRQKDEVQELKNVMREKEKEIENSVVIRKDEEEKLMILKSNLEKQTKEWLLVQEEVTKLYALTKEADETKEYFTTVKELLSEVKGSLVSSQKSLTHSKTQMEEHELYLSMRYAEVEELKSGIEEFMKHLRDGQNEVDKERSNLQATLARSKAVQQNLWIEKETMRNLNEKLMKEKVSLEKLVQETSKLQVELSEKNSTFGTLEALLLEKESELVEAKLEIQTLKGEVAKLQVSLSDRDAQLITTGKKLEEVNGEMSELKELLLSREEALAENETVLNEKNDRFMMIQNDLKGARKRVAEAENIVEKIVALTDELAKDGGFQMQEKMVESELDLTRESLRVTEGELVCAKRDLAMKEEELRRVVERLDAKEKELVKMKHEMSVSGDDVNKLFALSHEIKGEKTMGDLVIEKLEVEAAKMEVQVAIEALQQLVEMSGQLLNNGSKGVAYQVDGLSHAAQFHQVKSELSHLFTLTDHLLKQAGISI